MTLRKIEDQLMFGPPEEAPAPEPKKVIDLDAHRRLSLEAEREALEKRAAVVNQMLGVAMALAAVVASRILVLAGLGVGAVLAYFAVQSPSVGSIAACAVFDLGIFLPTIWLSLQRH